MSFYYRPEWRSLRFKVLDKYGYKCMACGRGKKENVILHVDHIKPKAMFPELALVEDNLQVLCEDCNMGKSDRYSNDLRPKEEIKPQTKKKRLRFGNRPWRETPPARRRAWVYVLIAHKIKEKLRVAEDTKDITKQAELMKRYLDILRMVKNKVTLYDEAAP